MRIIFITNVPSPYRVDFFRELSSILPHGDTLTVVFERHRASDREDAWYVKDALGFDAQFSGDLPVGADMSVGFGMAGAVKRLTRGDNPDGKPLLIFAGYSSPSVMCAINYASRHGFSYYVEFDGTSLYGRDGIVRRFKNAVKKRLLSNSRGFFITCEATAAMLEGFGISRDKMYKYPFSSIRERDVTKPSEREQRKQTSRRQLEIANERVVLAVGRFVQCKGFDVLLRAAAVMQKSGAVGGETAFYFVGGEPDDEFKALCGSLVLDGVRTVPFLNRSELDIYYDAADVLVLPTRHDSWGLVLCEAMARGLPVVTTDKCAAASELLREGENGFTVPADDVNALADAINRALTLDVNAAAAVSCEIMRGFTVERMALRHAEIFEKLKGGGDD